MTSVSATDSERPGNITKRVFNKQTKVSLVVIINTVLLHQRYCKEFRDTYFPSLWIIWHAVNHPSCPAASVTRQSSSAGKNSWVTAVFMPSVSELFFTVLQSCRTSCDANKLPSTYTAFLPFFCVLTAILNDKSWGAFFSLSCQCQ